MKRIILTVFALAVALMAGPALAVDLIADGGDVTTAINIGTVDISDDGTNLTVVFTTVGGWELVETHLGIRTTLLDGINVKGNGNVKVGKLSAAGEKTGRDFDPPVTTTTYTIALAGLQVGLDGAIDIAAHAAVEWLEILGVPDDATERPLDDPNDILHEESAWGDGTEFADDRNWSMYIEYRLLPDLIVSELTVTSYDSNSIQYSYTVENIGLAQANLDGPTGADVDNVSVQAFLSADQIFNNAGDLPAGGTILGSSPLGMLNPGDTFSGSFGSGASVNTSTHPYLTLKVDWGSVVDESDETNNTAATLIEVP